MPDIKESPVTTSLHKNASIIPSPLTIKLTPQDINNELFYQKLSIYSIENPRIVNKSKNPRKYIIEECIPACKELWSKNIYTFMVSDHLNDGECWIELDADALSDDNKSIYLDLDSNEVKKFSYHRGAINFGVRCVGKEAQEKLLEIAQKFEMQDVQEKLGYISIEKFLMDYCDCYEEYENP